MITATGRRVCIVAVSVIWPDSDSWLEPAQLPGGPDHAPDDVPDTSMVKTPFSDFAAAAAGAVSTPRTARAAGAASVVPRVLGDPAEVDLVVPGRRAGSRRGAEVGRHAVLD